METGTVKQRDKTMDIARGIAIMVMIMGHTECAIPRFNFLVWYRAWHMPVFYVLSGYFFNGRDSDIRSYIAKTARQLLVPFAFWLAFDYLYYFLQTFDFGYIKDHLLTACFVWPTGCEGFPVARALWFLIALFSLKAIYIVMTRLFTNEIVFYGMSAVFGFCGMGLAKFGMHLPFGLDAALVGVPFMAVGELLRKYGSRRFVKELMHMRWYVFVPVFVIVNWLFFYNGKVSFRGAYSSAYRNFALTYFNAIMGSILLFNISGFIAKKLTKIQGLHLIPDIFASVGMNSIIYVCINQRIISLAQPVYSEFLNSRPGGTVVNMCVTTVIVIFVGYIVMQIFAGNDKLKKFVGK